MNRAWFVGAIAATACCGPKSVNAPSSEMTVPQVVDSLAKARAGMTSFRGDSTMDYWLSGQRAKGEVMVMGREGKKIRFAALSPAGGSVLAEMACDGTNFVYVDHQNNCSLSGPCDARSIASFFNIALEPDDFVHLALGTPPVLDNPQGTSTWDGKGAWKVALTGAGGSQTISLNGGMDVLDSELKGADGKVRWSVANTDFHKVEGSGDRKVPGKTRFKSPAQNQDLLVEWNEFVVNEQLSDDKFVLVAPPGLATCGNQPKP